MLELTDAQIGGWVSAFLLPLFRIGALLMVMPVFGGHLVPVRVRLYLALAITLLLSPNLPPGCRSRRSDISSARPSGPSPVPSAAR